MKKEEKPSKTWAVIGVITGILLTTAIILLSRCI